VVFAWFCRHKGSAIIYIGLAKDFATVPVQGKNTKAKVEEELGFAIKPFELTKFCEGYITLEEALAILRKLNIFIPSVLIDIDDCLKQMTIQPTDEQIENFYKLAQPLLKNT
jgi:benzoyl-CoA reductase/2-hydroxyglutaryl-CoA dehydratase subunit BcrC/BadD/HgdB